MASQIFGSCWYPWQLQDIADNLPGTPRQYLSSLLNTSVPGFWQSVISSGVNGFSVKHITINKTFVDQAHSRLLSVTVWTVNNQTDMENAVSYGVDAIITDYPPMLVQVIQDYNNPSEQNIYIHVHIYVLVISTVIMFAVVASSLGLALFYYRRSKYTRL